MVNITAMANRARSARRRRMVWSRFVRVVAMVVVFCTTYALILPAITLESKAICGKTEHTHTAECYETVAPAACTLEETEGHTHAEGCYTYERQELTCELEEAEGHAHSDTCYESVLVCESSEQEDHTHDDSCYESVLTCELSENEGHAHCDACYNMISTLTCTEPESEGHSHADDSTEPEMVLVCELEEHVHDASCYPETEPTEESTDDSAVPAGDPNADLETAEDWEASLESVKLTGDWHKDILAVAQSQLGYCESTRNYQLVEDGSVRGITRYGQWYGIPYGDWCAMFVSFCVRYAEIPEEAFLIYASCQNWVAELDVTEEELLEAQDAVDYFRTPEEYIPVPGDLVFFEKDNRGVPNHVGLMVEFIEETEDTPAQIKVIEGNSDDRVQYVTYELENDEIVGYGVLPTEPSKASDTAKTYTYSDDDVQVDVVLPEDTTVPADAVLKVVPIEEKDDEYDDLVQQAEDTVDGAVKKIKLYDISFYTEDQEYIPVDDRAQVSMRFVESVLDAAADVAVLHYDETDAAPTVLEEVSVAEQAVDAETVVTFETDGFSIFAVVEIYPELAVVNTTTGLAGRTFAIAAVNFAGDQDLLSLPVLTATASTTTANRLAKIITQKVERNGRGDVVAITVDTADDVFWTFEEVKGEEDAYYIRSTTADQYLHISAKESLTLSGVKQEFVVEKAEGIVDGDTSNAICLRAITDNGDAHRVNMAANGKDNDFTSWNSGPNDRGNHLVLAEYEDQVYTDPVDPVEQIEFPDLDGKSYLIVGANFDFGNQDSLPPVMTTNEGDYLNSTNQYRHGMLSVSAADVEYKNNNLFSVTLDSYANAVWSFSAVPGKQNYYYVQDAATNKYLSIKPQNISLAGEPHEILVERATNLEGQLTQNAICLSEDGVYVNKTSNQYLSNFTGYAGGTGDPDDHLALVEYKPQQVTSNAAGPQTVNILNNLAGKQIVITNANNNLALSGDQYSWIDNENTTHQALKGYAATVGNGGASVTLSSYNQNAVWEFVGTNNPGQYKIKLLNRDWYLNIDEEERSGDKSLSISQNQQNIEVVASGYGDTVWLRLPKVYKVGDSDVQNYADYFGNKGGTICFGVWQYDSASETGPKNRQFYLSEYNGALTMDVISPKLTQTIWSGLNGNYIISAVNLDDGVGTPLMVSATDYGEGRISGLLAKPADSYRMDAGKLVSVTENGDDLDVVWKFTPVEGKNATYHIMNTATRTYLNLNGFENLTLSENPQEIQVVSAEVFVAGDAYNAVCLVANGVNLQLWFNNRPNEDQNLISAKDGFVATERANHFALTRYNAPTMDGYVAPEILWTGLGGKSYIIANPAQSVAVSSDAINATDDNPMNDRLAAQTVRVIASTGKVIPLPGAGGIDNLVWSFEDAGESGQYFIKAGNGQYLHFYDGDTGGDKPLTLSNTRQALEVVSSGNGNTVWIRYPNKGVYTGSPNDYYALDLYGGVINSGFGVYQKSNGFDQNNQFILTEVTTNDSGKLSNLDGMTLAMIGIHDGNSGTKRMALTSDTNANTNYLNGVEVTLQDTTGELYNFNDENFPNNNELWVFEAVERSPDVYYIVTANSANTNNKQYLNIGEDSAYLSSNPQQITLVPDTVVGGDGITYDVVYLTVEVNGKTLSLRRELNGNDTGFYGKDTGDLTDYPERRIVLAQPSAQITIDVSHGINEENEGWLYRPQFADGSQVKTVSAKYGGYLPTTEELGAEPVENLQGTSKIQHFVYFCINESWDAYTAGKGRDFPQAYLASWAPELANGQGYVDRTLYTKEEFAAILKSHVYDPEDFKGESPYWGTELELTHFTLILPGGSTQKDADRNDAKFAPGTAYTLNANGTVEITDVNGVTYEVPSGSKFDAQYKEFSDILTFYINLYGVVEDIAGDIKPVDIEKFTLGLSLAHIYNPGQYAGESEDDYDNANASIDALFKGAYGENVDPDVMHAVIDGFITRKYPEYRDDESVNNPNLHRYLSNRIVQAPGASAAALHAHVLDYIRTVNDVDIMLKNYEAGNNEATPTLNNSTIDTASFKVRWYVVKDQGDSWHIDGVVIGNTAPVIITKTFHGLNKNEQNQELTLVPDRMAYNDNHTNFRMDVSIYDGDGTPRTYYYMDPSNGTSPAKEGQYLYNGGANPYSWTMSAILKQKYQVQEENYEFEGYERFSTVTVTDVDGNSTITSGLEATVTGGETASVAFNNYYTKTGTGMFLIQKKDAATGLPLAGAEFTLTKDGDSSFEYSETTDANGQAIFYNLQPGENYTLRETKAPNGYLLTDETWPISVFKDGDVVRVMTGRLSLFPMQGSNGVISFNPLSISNTPEHDVLNVVKQFVGITPEQVAKLGDYKIVVQHSGGTTYTLKLKDDIIKPVVSDDGLTYTWTLTDVPEGDYFVTESGYELENLLTSVTVTGMSDGTYTTAVSEPVIADNLASFDAIFVEDHADGFIIRNSYSSDFSIQITKVDSTNNEIKLSGATFKVYGDHAIATSEESIEVAGRRLYYLGEVTTEGEGVATFSGWNTTENDQQVFHKLVLGYPYALVETEAPHKYIMSSEPIYLGIITADGVKDLDNQSNTSFRNGVFYITVENLPGIELPEAGGMGTLMYTLGGAIAMAAPVVYGFGKKRKKQRRADG